MFLSASRLKELRVEKGKKERRKISVRIMSEEIGIPRGTIAGWESDGAVGGVKKHADYVKLCNYFGIPVNNELQVDNPDTSAVNEAPTGYQVTEEEFNNAEPVEDLDEVDSLISRHYSPIGAAALYVLGKAFATPLDKADYEKLFATQKERIRLIYTDIESFYELDQERREQMQEYFSKTA
jgi:transcriptional regulator with XRE-family HTH domain